jgi:hypothetical protein
VIKDRVLLRSGYETRAHPNSDILARIMWLTRGETPNDLKTPDARAMDADRFHWVGPVGVICTLLIAVARLR